MRQGFVFISVAMVSLLVIQMTGCGGDDVPPSVDDLFKQQMELPAVYLTGVTGKRVQAPTGKSVFTDPETGEPCWPAWACHNPDCPGRAADGEPFLFIWPNPHVLILPDGSFTGDPKLGKPLPAAPPNSPFIASSLGCPECVTIRKINSENAAQKAKYNAWIKPYELPENAKRMKELDELRAKRLKIERETN